MGFSQVPTDEINLMAYAVIQTGGKQYRVAEGDVIEVEKLDVAAVALRDAVLLASCLYHCVCHEIDLLCRNLRKSHSSRSPASEIFPLHADPRTANFDLSALSARVVKWQTRTFEGRMPKGMGVQVPPRALVFIGFRGPIGRRRNKNTITFPS